MRGEWENWGYFPPSRPLAAKGGIRSQSKRGRFGESWWAKRWISVLESFNLGGRLQRGRSYARNGQVLSIDVEKGTVTARVQGSRPQPYMVAIGVKTLSEKDWRKIAEAISTQAIFAAKLLGGEMPQEIESLFQGAGFTLFPGVSRDLKTECSCPDWSNPCKHIAAVYYLLGEQFDADPFLILKMRGMPREEFLRLIGESGIAAAQSNEPELPPEPLPASPEAFWATGELPQDLLGPVPGQPVGAALPKRLGGFPFWRGSENLLDVLESIYVRAGAKASEMLGGGPE
jgi:uncharacterized Zn finger protein